MEVGMTDDAFEQLIRSVGEEMNRPPAAPPLDAIWRRIEPDVRAALEAPSAPRLRPWPLVAGVGAALAATLLIGVMIGKGMREKGVPAAVPTALAPGPDETPRAYAAATIRQLNQAQ